MKKVNQKSNGKMAIVYCRVATEYVDNRDKSIEGQKRLCTERAILDGNKNVQFIGESASGMKMNRKGLKKLIKLVKERKVSSVYVMDMTRLSRNVNGFAVLKDLFAKYNVRLRTVKTVEEQFCESIFGAMANYERKLYSERIKRGIARKKALIS